MSETHVIPVSDGLLEPKHISSIGPAIYVFLWMINRTTKEVGGEGYVLGGTPIRSQVIAESLGFRDRTVRDHVDVLCDGNYIRREKHSGGFYSYYVQKTKKWLKPAKNSPPAVGENPPAVGENPPAVGENPPAVGENPPAVGENPPAVGENPPAYIRKIKQDNTRQERITPPAPCESNGPFALREQGANQSQTAPQPGDLAAIAGNKTRQNRAEMPLGGIGGSYPPSASKKSQEGAIPPQETPSQRPIKTTKQPAAVESADLSLFTRILAEQIGCFDMREQSSLAQLLSSHARHANKSLEEAVSHIISRWREYQKAVQDGLLSYPYGSAYKFLMSGKWDAPATWNWKNGHSPEKPKRRYVEVQ